MIKASVNLTPTIVLLLVMLIYLLYLFDNLIS